MDGAPLEIKSDLRTATAKKRSKKRQTLAVRVWPNSVLFQVITKSKALRLPVFVPFVSFNVTFALNYIVYLTPKKTLYFTLTTCT